MNFRSDRKRNILFLPCYRDSQLLDGVCQFAFEVGWTLDCLYYYVDHLPMAWDGDGIICMLDVAGRNPAQTEFVKRHAHIPMVGLSLNDPSLNMVRVLQDNREIGKMGADHLASIGCEELGFVVHDVNHFHSERYEGFYERGVEYGLSVRQIVVPEGFASSPKGNDWFLKSIPETKPFGVMAAADYLARWVLETCIQGGVSIPDDVALVGVDNCKEVCELSPVEISSIDNNSNQQGYRAAQVLEDLIDGIETTERSIRVAPGSLHTRQSSNLLAISHPHVATALRYIADCFCDPELTVKKVAEQVPMSERRLHDAFLRCVKRSIYNEINDRRLQYAKKLIKNTDKKLWDVAELSGFASPEVMSRVFKRKTGHPPSTFRASQKRSPNGMTQMPPF